MASTISSIMSSAETGDRSAADELFAALYAELHRVARSQLARGGGGFEITSLGGDAGEAAVDEKELGQIGEALDDLAATEPPFAEIAAMGGVSERSVQRRWEKVRLDLRRKIRRGTLV